MIDNLISEVDRLSGQQVEMCYHCHKCTAGCPVIEQMSYGPDRVLRMVALGETEALLNSADIWLCAGCYTCATRCPNDIDISAVMDALRQIASQQGVPAAEPDVFLFHRLFMGVVRMLGRSYEGGTLGLFKVLSHVPFKNDMGAGVGLFVRGKVPLMPKSSGKTTEIREIFERSR
jgi:heterodisulfide reductase subunit C